MNNNTKNPDLGFTPSVYQQKIFDFVAHGHGNAVVSAVAGSGKTTSIVAATKFIPPKQTCLFIAFNKSIVEELTKHLADRPNITAMTCHGLGESMIVRNCDGEAPVVDEYKYRTFIKHNIGDLTNVCENMTPRQIDVYIDNVSYLVDYSRYNLCQTVREVEEVALRYGVGVSRDECEAVLKCLEWGRTHIDTVDFTDMVWLPYELSLAPRGLQFDWVIIDEAQDMSMMMYQLFLKCFKRGTRFIAVGDENQSINMWAGASPYVFQSFREHRHTQEFHLPISYRCDRAITDFANQLIPGMMCRPDAGPGKVEHDVSYKRMRSGDLVLCRTKTPLVRMYVKLLRHNMKSYIKGQDIGLNLSRLVESVDCDTLNANLRQDGVFVRLWDKLFERRNSLMRKRGLDLADATLSVPIMAMYDTMETLRVLAERRYTKAELLSQIGRVFLDDGDGICLSTVHKAKGLEADNVFICCHSSMPSKLAKMDWELRQEQNLQYVAYTRAKHWLGFVSEDVSECPVQGTLRTNGIILNELKNIEAQICSVLGKEPMADINNVELNAFRVQNIEDLPTDIYPEPNMVVVGQPKESDAKQSKIDEIMSFF